MATCPQGQKEVIDVFDPLGDGENISHCVANLGGTPAAPGATDKKKGGLSFNDIIAAVGQLGKVGADYFAVSKGQSTQPIINNNYTTDPNAKPADDGKMPNWAIALIVLVVLVLLAVIFSNKKRGATPQ